MDYKVLYRKYRPSNFDDLVGQDHIKDLLVHSIINKKLSHAYLFTGPRGTGKTSAAKLFAKVVNCENNKNGKPCLKCNSCLNYENSTDIIEIDAASNNGVDEIRELRDNVKISPSISKYKVYIIDEVHMLTASAWNAFLKTLEEPPAHVMFILATTELHKIPITVLSRCQRFDFIKISDEIIIKKLKEISKKENIKITDDSLTEIAYLSSGSLRDGLGILDQLSKLNSNITMDLLKTTYGIIAESDIEEFIKLLKGKNIKKIIEKINMFESKGIESELFLNKILDSLVEELIEYKSTGISTIDNLADLIIQLESCYAKNNRYLLIKAIVLKNTNVENEIDIINVINEKKIEKVIVKNKEIISREIISEKKLPEEIIDSIDSEVINIRINNSFAGADIKLKKDFVKKWNKLNNHFLNIGETKYISLLKNANIEVVSPTNVLLSSDSYSNSILFNLVCDDISIKCKEIIGEELKIVCIDSERWKKEKELFIKNKNKKIYELIKEPSKVKTNKSVELASNIFGEELIETK